MSGNDPFGNYVYLTQVIQAMCIKAEAEHYRRLKGDEETTMGAIYWYFTFYESMPVLKLQRKLTYLLFRQLNDIWQAPTWSSLEYDGRWKMLQYHARDFFSPFLVSSYEDPTDSYNVYITSDLMQVYFPFSLLS